MATAAAPSVSSAPTVAAPSRQRIDSVDLLRGLVMVIMMLDHTREFSHWASFQFDPADITKTYPALFATRWITHFCAPVFFFLAGTGAYLKRTRGASTAEVSRFLWTRGLWLVLLEITVVRIGITFSVDYRFLGPMQTIWALGWSMVVLAALIRLPVRVIGAIGVLMIGLHDLADGVKAATWSAPGSPVPDAASKLWMVLHQVGAFPIAGWPSPVVFIQYPLVPLIGVMAAGFAFGTVYEWTPEARRRLLLRVGLATTALFLVLRALNEYGDPSPWAVQTSAAMTVVSFFNTSKYPTSLMFLAMTLGPSLLFLAWAEARERGAIGRALVTLGRVPLFFYIGQWYVAHGFSWLLHRATGRPTTLLFFDIDQLGPPEPALLARTGFPLWVTYVAWIAGVALLYPLCKWFAGVKARRRDWWLGYL